MQDCRASVDNCRCSMYSVLRRYSGKKINQLTKQRREKNQKNRRKKIFFFRAPPRENCSKMNSMASIQGNPHRKAVALLTSFFQNLILKLNSFPTVTRLEGMQSSELRLRLQGLCLFKPIDYGVIPLVSRSLLRSKMGEVHDPIVSRCDEGGGGCSLHISGNQ